MGSIRDILHTKDNKDVYETLAGIDVGEQIQVVIQRYSRNSGHFISYPAESRIDDEKDGVHIELRPAKERFVKNILSIDDSYILCTVRIAHKEGDGYNFTMANLTEFGEVFIPKIDQHNVEDITSILRESGGSFDQLDLVLENPDYDDDIDSRSNETSNQSVEKISTASGRPELPPEPKEKNKTFLYYVDTKKAECYHRTRNCQGLKKTQREIRIVEAEVNGELPQQVNDLRKCHRC